ncbi:hypothetical protein D3C87_323380 [compost metagenome]
MSTEGIVYAYRKRRKPDGENKFFVFEFEGADITNEEWKANVAQEVFTETVGAGVGEVIFMWKNNV